MLQSRLQGGATEEVPAGTPDRHLSSPHGALPILPAATAAQPHPGKDLAHIFDAKKGASTLKPDINLS